MSVSSASIKKVAKGIYKRNTINLTVVTAVIMSVWFIFSNIASIVQVFTHGYAYLIIMPLFIILLFLPLFFGFLRYCWRVISGVADNPIAVFYYFSHHRHYLKSLRLIITLLVRIVISFFIFYIPVFVLDLITGTWLYSTLDIAVPMWTTNLSTISSILSFLATVATIFASLKLYLAPMLFVADENMDTAEAIHLSAVITKITTLDIIFLLSSFSGWFLLSFLSLPILFTLPYFIISYLIHSSYSVGAFNERVSNTNYDDIPTFIAGA